LCSAYWTYINHEVYTNEYQVIKQKLIEAKVIVLDNESTIISKNGQNINLIGVIDPEFYYNSSREENNLRLNEELKKLSNNKYFQILLTHRPELMNYYVGSNIDLVFAGHTHGGQIRFPIIGGIIAPNQGVFPKYISGKYIENSTTLIVNRGLGATRIPFRVLNTPEIILVELQSE
jgi:predicted MPP superfamily phosphohydrolase